MDSLPKVSEDFNSTKFILWLSAYALTLCFVYMFAAAWFQPKNQQALTQGSIIIGNIIMLIVGYLWGSSAGSARKNDTINKLLAPGENQETLVKVDNIEPKTEPNV